MGQDWPSVARMEGEEVVWCLVLIRPTRQGETVAVKPVFIVDDEPNIRLLISMVLEEAGYKTVIATDGQECLDAVDSVDPGLVLLDLRMPRKGGAETLAELRARPATRDVPVIIISGTTELESGMEVNGATDVLVKPFDLEVLLELVRRYFPPPGQDNGGRAAG